MRRSWAQERGIPCHQGNYQVENALLFSSSSGFFLCSPHYPASLGKHAGSKKELRTRLLRRIAASPNEPGKPPGSTKSGWLFCSAPSQVLHLCSLPFPLRNWKWRLGQCALRTTVARLPEAIVSQPLFIFLSGFIFLLMKQRAQIQVRKIQPTNSALFKQTFHSSRQYLCSTLSLFLSGNCLFLLISERWRIHSVPLLS